jgi:hypothetical protein
VPCNNPLPPTPTGGKFASLTGVHQDFLTLPLTFKVVRMFPGDNLLVVFFAHDDSRLVNWLNGCSRLTLLLVAASAGKAPSSAPAGCLYTILTTPNCSDVRCEQEVRYCCVTRAAAVTAAAAVAAAVRWSPARDTPAC